MVIQIRVSKINAHILINWELFSFLFPSYFSFSVIAVFGMCVSYSSQGTSEAHCAFSLLPQKNLILPPFFNKKALQWSVLYVF